MQERWLRGHVTDDFLWEKKRIRLRIRIRIGFIFVFCVTHLTQLQLPVCCPLFSATGNYHLRNTGDLFFLSDTVQPLKLHASTLAIIKLRHQSARTRAAQLQIARAITTRKSWSRLGRWGGPKWSSRLRKHVLGPARRYRYKCGYYSSQVQTAYLPTVPGQLGDYAIYKILPLPQLHLQNAIEGIYCIVLVLHRQLNHL